MKTLTTNNTNFHECSRIKDTSNHVVFHSCLFVSFVVKLFLKKP